MDLSFGRIAPASGKTRSMVIFVHGYGANGADLLGLADPLKQHLPDTVFLAPDAPEPCRNNPFGFQWFPIPRLDGSSTEEMEEGFARSLGLLEGFITDRLAAEGVAPERLVLVGFSQGTMMSLHIAPRYLPQIGGVVGFSGRLLVGERLAAEVVARPPVLLLHGDQDPMVPFDEMARGAAVLAEAGCPIHTHVMRDTGHGISPDGLGVALAFLRERVG